MRGDFTRASPSLGTQSPVKLQTQKYSNTQRPVQQKRAASINSDDFIDEDEDPELMDAIMASLLTPELNDDGT